MKRFPPFLKANLDVFTANLQVIYRQYFENTLFQRSAWAWAARGVHTHDVYMRWAELPTVWKLGPGVTAFFYQNQSWGPWAPWARHSRFSQ